MTLRAFLCRTANYGTVDYQAVLWPIESGDDVELAVADLTAVLRSKGSEVIDRWSDTRWSYDWLATNDPIDEYAEPGLKMWYPGRLGSTTRHIVLAALADINNEPELEKSHLRELLTWSPRVVDRLRELS